MFGSTMLDVAIGIAFVYLLLSLICSTLDEFVVRVLAMRATNLEQGIKNLLGDPEHTEEVKKQIGLLLGNNLDKTVASVQEKIKALGPGYAVISAQVAEKIKGWADQDLAKIEAEIKKLGQDHDAAIEAAIREVLPDLRTVTAKLYAHPLVKGLYEQGWFDRVFRREGKPSYISSRTFALALLDIAVPQDKSQNLQSVKDLAQAIRDSNTVGKNAAQALLTLLDTSEKKLETSRKNIEDWFNEGMDRVTGWYKRKTQVIVFFLAVVVTIALNADTLTIAKTLSADPTLRNLVVSSATEFIKATQTAQAAAKTGTPTPAGTPLATAVANATPTPAPTTNISTTVTNLNTYRTELLALPLPFGWCAPKDSAGQPTVTFWPPCTIENDPHQIPVNLYGWLSKILGLLITVIAVSLGAPFWFDLLSKLVNLRGTGDAPKKETSALSPDERSSSSST